MNPYIITAIAISVNLLTLVLTYISATKKFEDNRSKNLKRIKKGGWIFIGYGILLIFVQTFQTYLNDQINLENQDKREALLYSKLKKSADSSVLKFKISTDSSTLNIMELLASYKLKYDSTQNRLVDLIKDSAKTKIIEEESPTMSYFHSLTEKYKFSVFEYSGIKVCSVCLISNNATSRNIKLNTSVLFMDDNQNVTYFKKLSLFNDNDIIPKDNIAYRKFEITNVETPPAFIFWMRGRYWNNNLTKQFSFDEVFYFNTKTNAVGAVSGNFRKIVVELVKQVEK